MNAAISTHFAPPPFLALDDERRDCPRIPLAELELAFGGGVFAGFGDVSVGGALFLGALPELPSRVEVRFQLPGEAESFRLEAVVLAAEIAPNGTSVHLRFVEIPFDAERRIARHVDECLILIGQR